MTPRILAALTALSLAGLAPAARAVPETPELTIQPGVQVATPSGLCTANFVYQAGSGTFDPSGTLYIGTAGHCGSLGDTVYVAVAAGTGRIRLGTIVHDDDGGPDLALIQIDADLNSRVSPSVRLIGGPTGIYAPGTSPVPVGFSGHGSGIGTGGTARYGLLTASGSNATIVTASGDSGGPFVTTEGDAVGLLNWSGGKQEASNPIGIGANAHIRRVQDTVTVSATVLKLVTCPTATPWPNPGCPPV